MKGNKIITEAICPWLYRCSSVRSAPLPLQNSWIRYCYCTMRSFIIYFMRVDVDSVNPFKRCLRSRKNVFHSLSPNSDKHLISPYNIPTWSTIQITRIKEMITKHKNCVLMLVKILPTSTIRIILRTLRRTYILIMGLKRLNDNVEFLWPPCSIERFSIEWRK